MLFLKSSHVDIRSGAIRRAYRMWKAPRVRCGGLYRLGTDGAVEVQSVARVPIGKISAEDAQVAGFDSVESLREELGRTAKKRVTGAMRVYCVAFRFVPG